MGPRGASKAFVGAKLTGALGTSPSARRFEGPPVKKKRGLFFFSTDFLRVSPEPAERRAPPVIAPGSWLCGCVRAGEPRATGRAALPGGNAEHVDARVTLPPPVCNLGRHRGIGNCATPLTSKSKARVSVLGSAPEAESMMLRGSLHELDRS